MHVVSSFFQRILLVSQNSKEIKEDTVAAIQVFRGRVFAVRWTVWVVEGVRVTGCGRLAQASS